MSSQFRPQWRAKDVEHKMIMDAVIARDSQTAQDLCDRHIRETTANVIAHASHLFAQPGTNAGEMTSGALAAERLLQR